jgi:hypothetical protein
VTHNQTQKQISTFYCWKECNLFPFTQNSDATFLGRKKLTNIFCLHQMKEILRYKDVVCVFSVQEEDTSDRMVDQTKSISL